MQEFSSNGILIARHIAESDLQKVGLNFLSNDDEFIQLGLWNYNLGEALPAHRHNEFERLANRTCEILYVVSGSVHADIYSEELKLTAEIVIRQNELLVCLSGGHGYKILENNTRVLEFKNGPYFGSDIDRTRFVSQCTMDV